MPSHRVSGKAQACIPPANGKGQRSSRAQIGSPTATPCFGDRPDVVQRGPPRPRREPVSAEARQRDTTGATPGGHDDGFTYPGPITTNGRAAWRDRGSRRRLHGGGRGQYPTGRSGRARPELGRREPARPRCPPDRHDSQARPQQRPGDRKGLAPGIVCASAGRPGDISSRRPVSPAGGRAGVLVLPLVCVCLGLLWLRPRPVAAAFTPGLAVLPTPARATWWGQFGDPAGV